MHPITKKILTLEKPPMHIREGAVLNSSLFRMLEAGQAVDVVPWWHLIALKTIAMHRAQNERNTTKTELICKRSALEEIMEQKIAAAMWLGATGKSCVTGIVWWFAQCGPAVCEWNLKRDDKVLVEQGHGSGLWKLISKGNKKLYCYRKHGEWHNEIISMGVNEWRNWREYKRK